MQLGLFLVASFLGVIVGAILQYVLGLRTEEKRNIQLRRTEAYVDLIKALAAMAKPGDEGDEGRQVRIAYAEARTRVAIYGSTAVIAALATFLRLPESENTDAPARLAEVVKAMRVDGLGRAPSPPDSDLTRVLFASPATSAGDR